MNGPLLGCIADDFTGATDLASNLVEAGMRVVQCLGLPSSRHVFEGADAVVIALKTRSVPPGEAVAESLKALSALQSLGATRFYLKYCSTFDSTDEGNIGPVAEALMESLRTSQTIFCPAFPENLRTVYMGHLFVGQKLLCESGMELHPLNPMVDANLLRVLAKQSRLPVGLVPYSIVERGEESILEAIQILHEAGKALLIVDALNNQHLRSIAKACTDMPLVTGGSGLAIGLPEAYRAREMLSGCVARPSMPIILGRTAILAGSCSHASQEQVAFAKSCYPTRMLNAGRCVTDCENVVDEVIRWSLDQDPEKPVVIASTADASEVAKVQMEFGKQTVAHAVESTLARVAKRIVDECSVRRLVIAGGETSGAVVSELSVRALRIGPRIAPGVPWTESIDGPPLALALKSGNFGGPEFFQRAVEMFSK